MTDRELMQQVLHALECATPPTFSAKLVEDWEKAVEDLRARLAQPEPEPVAWADRHDIDREGHDFHVSRQQPAKDGVPLYTAPRQHDFIGLTDEELKDIFDCCECGDRGYIAAMVEAKLKEKNT